MKRCSGARSQDPHTPPASEQGNAARLLGRDKQAVSYFRSAAELTASSEPLVKMAYSENRLGRPEEALKALEEAKVRYPFDYQAYIDAGHIYAAQGNIEQARGNFEAAVRLAAFGPSLESLRARLQLNAAPFLARARPQQRKSIRAMEKSTVRISKGQHHSAGANGRHIKDKWSHGMLASSREELGLATRRGGVHHPQATR